MLALEEKQLYGWSQDMVLLLHAAQQPTLDDYQHVSKTVSTAVSNAS